MRADVYALNHALADRHWWFVARRRIVRMLLERVVPPSPEALVLDVGCGSGGNLAGLTDLYRCAGVDREPQAIGIARSRHPSAEFVCGSAPDDVRGLLSQARAVLLMDVLEHVEDDFLLLSQTLAAMAPGAHLLVTVPAEPALWSAHDVSHHHYRRYTSERLARLWAEFPVTIRLHSPFNARLYPIIRAVREVGRRRGRTAGIGQTDLKQPPPLINRLLTSVFAGEGTRLLATLDGPSGRPYRRGVSLLTLLRRERGECPVRPRPADVPPDPGASGAQERSRAGSMADGRGCSAGIPRPIAAR